MKLGNLTRVLAALAVAGQLGACAVNPKPFPPMTRLGNLADTGDRDGDHLEAGGPIVALRQVIDAAVKVLAEPLNESHRTSPVVVATAADLTDLQVSRALGQAVSEQVVSSLVSRGFTVREIRLRSELAMRNASGELLLTRDLQDLATSEHPAGWAVVGTYAVAKHTTFVHLRALRLSDGVILSTSSFELPHDHNVRALLIDRPVGR